MVVDDHPVVRKGLIEMLRAESRLEVIAQACGGREAVEQFRAVRPDVVLMDLRMPDMGGVEAIEAIRGIDSDAKIIIMTAVDGEEDIYRGLRAGAKGYILKDAPDQEVVRAVHMTTEG